MRMARPASPVSRANRNSCACAEGVPLHGIFRTAACALTLSNACASAQALIFWCSVTLGGKRMGVRLPLFEWLPGYSRADVRGDLIAGLTVGAMLIPQGMGYALLAGLPPEAGLYASVLPLLAYAALGGSRQLGIGPPAISSLLTAAGLAKLADGDPATAAGLAATLAVIVGLMRVALGVGRLG